MRFRKTVSTLRVGFGLVALLFLLPIFLLAGEAHAQTRPQSPVPLPTPFTPIVDYANVIDADTRQRLESIYLNLKERGGTVFSVLTVQTIGEQNIFDYSLAVARGWGIGPPDAETPSFLLVVAIQDRKYFTQVSQHLEGDLPDGIVGQIQRERLVPLFKQGNYSKGIYDTVQAYIATLAANRGFSIEGIDQRYAYRDGNGSYEIREIRQSRGRSLTTVCCGIIFVLFIVILISSAARRGGRGGRGGRGRRGGFGRGGFGGGGLLEALLWGSVLGNLTSGGRGWGSSSGWGSSGGFGSGGFGGGGGGGFGGGFGGGDSFGGGGAGGEW